MGKFSYRGHKRKLPQGKEKKQNLRENAKHLIDYGVSHPLDDKKLKLGDKLAKRIYEDDIAIKKSDKVVEDKELIDEESVQDSDIEEEKDENFYDQLLSAFGKEQKADPESDESESEMMEQIKPNQEMVKNGYEAFNTENEMVDDENKDDEDEEGDDLSNVQQLKFDHFQTHFFTNFTCNEIEQLKKCALVNTSFDWTQIGSFVESRVEDERFNLVQLDSKLSKSLDHLPLKQSLKENIPKTMMEITGNECNRLSAFQLELLRLLSSYKDLYFPERTEENSELIRMSYCLHSLNHILKTRARILWHNSKLTQNKVQKEEYRDQGLTRPKVLIILPFRDSAYRTVNCMINLLFADARDTGMRKINIMNYKRFQKEFGPSDDESHISSRKPEDYRKMFNGNIDDSFRVGMSITKKSLKLYNDFYSSDIIIASPLGLRMIIGAEGDQEREYDFLSSLDMVIFDQSELFLMQNWEHVLHLMDHIHLRPKKDHGVDYTRVKLWVLELWSRFYCQLLVFSSISSTMISGLFNKYSSNYSGKLIVKNSIPSNRSAINRVFIQCPQTFQRFHSDTYASNSDVRFNFFINKILPKYKDKLMVRTMIYVPSYFDFVRLRNYFRKEDIGFSQICEYTDTGKVAKARHIFFYGGRQFLLYTERFHFFNRHTIKGIRHLIFYEPPTFPHFYSELINMMHLSNQGKKLTTDYGSMSVTVLFNRFDAHSLVGLTGTETASNLITSDSDVHMFLTENALS
ncbi:hypothetical protein BLOT_005276 [Blomia tropicalis]|nr:hypothetical protein BLOT_005276 [Blomia tropicalis]